MRVTKDIKRQPPLGGVDRLFSTEVQSSEGGSILPPSFFARSTARVARELLGCEIVRKIGRTTLRGRIVETEAYLGAEDPASHGSRGPTPRAKIMYGPPGVIYVYFIYGVYFMLNFVTEKEGTPGAVLIRAVEPIEGLTKTTNGPAKLVMAYGIDGSLNGKTLGLPHLAVLEGRSVSSRNVVTTTRVGINVGKELPLRFYEKGNRFVSRL